jgi:hypothetical protein
VAILANLKHYELNRDSSGRFTRKDASNTSAPDNTGNDYTSALHKVTASLSTTRPSSSLSTFELLDTTQASTPFELTPPISPAILPLTVNLDKEPPPPYDTMSNEHVTPFHGDREDENPEDFLRSFYRRMGTGNEAAMKQQFQNFLQADSAADEWFDELQEADKKDWNAIEAAFHKRWPRKKAAKKTTVEYEEEITGLKLKIEDMGKKEKIAGREVYSHIAWADKMAITVRGAKLEGTTTYIGHVRKDLPKMVREKVGAVHADWTAFLQAVRDVEVDHIKEGVELWKKGQEENEAIRKRIQQLEKLTASPTGPIRQQMSAFNISNQPPATTQSVVQASGNQANPFTSNTGGRGNLSYPAQARPPVQNTRPPATQADRTALLACLQKYPHHPDTEAGRQAH